VNLDIDRIVERNLWISSTQRHRYANAELQIHELWTRRMPISS